MYGSSSAAGPARRSRPTGRAAAPRILAVASSLTVLVLLGSATASVVSPPFPGSYHRVVDRLLVGCGSVRASPLPAWNASLASVHFSLRATSHTAQCSSTTSSNESEISGTALLRGPLRVPPGTHTVRADWNVSLTAVEGLQNHGACSIVVRSYLSWPCWAESGLVVGVDIWVRDATTGRNYTTAPTFLYRAYFEEGNQIVSSPSGLRYSNYTTGAPNATSAAFSASPSLTFASKAGHRYLVETFVWAQAFADVRGYPDTTSRAWVDLAGGSSGTRLLSMSVT